MRNNIKDKIKLLRILKNLLEDNEIRSLLKEALSFYDNQLEDLNFLTGRRAVDPKVPGSNPGPGPIFSKRF